MSAKSTARLLPVFLVLISLLAPAQMIPEDKATEIAGKFMLSRDAERRTAPGSLMISEFSVRRNTSHILYYIINYAEGGFILITADKRFYPVLAYSFDGHFDADHIPDNCRVWIRAYESQMESALLNGGPYADNMQSVWDRIDTPDYNQPTTTGVLPLTTAIWTQDGYYNQMCPADQEGYNGHAPVGCIALAMAQLMHYYRFPEFGSGSELYTPSYQGGVYGPQYVDFAASTYSWNAMTDICREPNDAIAQLCYHAGVSVQTSYMPTASGANINNVPEALVSHFFYLADDYLLRSGFPDTRDWVTLLIQNLDKRQPVYYRSALGWGGHAYICDGYQDSTHFHFNWGWGGAYNGFFYIDNLTPGGIDINSSQGAIFNIYPDTTQFQYPVNTADPAVLTSNIGSFEDGSGPLNYLTGVKLTWLVKPDDPEITNLLLEFSTVNTEAESDMIRVYDGETEQAPLIASISGNGFPVSLNSSGPSLLVTFESDDQNSADGFHANYYGYHLPFCSGNQLLTDAAGVLGDGSRYHEYSNNSDCEWVISPFLSLQDSIEKVSLNFKKFNLASGDTVFIYDGIDKESPMIGKFSTGDTPPGMVSAGNKVFVRFTSDQENTSKGWDLGWECVIPVYCNDTAHYNSAEAVIADGSGLKNYVENSDCYYVIEAPDDLIININFLEFDLETDYDYIKFYDPEYPEKPLLKLSGHELPDPFTLPYNKLLVHFHSDFRDNCQGWKFAYNSSSSAIEEFQEKFSLYPNPVHDKLTVQSNYLRSTETVYALYRIDGLVVFSGMIASSTNIIDLSSLSPGMYFIIFKIDGKNYQHKILKY